jgi:PST family polysaccharide transporter
MKSAPQLVSTGVTWSLLSQLVKLGSQLVGMIVLARLLPMSDFGLISMASVFTGFALLFRDFGSSATVIQRHELTPQILDSVFLFNIIVGFFLALVLALFTPVAVWFFSEPRLYGVLWLLVLVFPVGALSLVHQALMERGSDFKSVAIIESLATLLGLASAVGGAWFGWGVYSLVTQTLVSACFTTTCLWFFSQWRPGVKGSLIEIKGLWKFAGNFVGFNVFNYFARNADNMLIGRFLGASDLGIYSMAYRLMTLPIQITSGVVGRALFPVLSRMQNDPDRLAEAYLRTVTAGTLVNAPLLMGFFVLRESFIKVVMGSQWMPVADLLKWLIPIALLQSLGTTVGYLYLAMGRTDVMLKWGIFGGTTIVIGFYLGLQWGLQGLVIGYAVVYVLIFIPSLIIPYQLVGLKVSRVLLSILPSVLNALAMAALVMIVDSTWNCFENEPIFRLITLIIFGILIFAVLVYLFQHKLLQDILRVFAIRYQ